MEFSQLKKNNKKDFSSFPATKVAILGDTPTQLLHQALKGYGYEHQLNLEIFEADIDQIDRQIFDQDSELYAFHPEFVLVYSSIVKLQQKFIRSNCGDFAQQHLDLIHSRYEALKDRGYKIIYFNYPEISDGVFGNFSNKINFSFLYQSRKINLGLMDLAQQAGSLSILDVCNLQSVSGRNNAFNPTLFVNTSFEFSLEFLVVVAKNVLDIVLSIKGKFKKCLILDLDNTLWGGIIGDDGWENIQIGDLGTGKAFTQMQFWAKQLQQRGVILCICSKNSEEIARVPFEKHPDMVLRMDDIAVFVANWDTKADNIRHIQSILNIGFDSMVFVDDNPFERNFVRTEIPEICVPELPEDPAEYTAYISSLNLFEVSSISENDVQRTQQYQVEAKRASNQKKFANENEFLQSLEMKCLVKAFDNFDIPRVSQLSQRSNQFNLRTVRYTDEDIRAIANNDHYITRSFSLQDKFGDYGLVSLIILKKEPNTLFIDTWLMSCRVLKRGLEKFVLNALIGIATEENVQYLVGEYIPTAKNSMVENHYRDLGFQFDATTQKWKLDIQTSTTSEVFIQQ